MLKGKSILSMKAMKGSLLKIWSRIPDISTLKQSLAIQLYTSDIISAHKGELQLQYEDQNHKIDLEELVVGCFEDDDHKPSKGYQLEVELDNKEKDTSSLMCREIVPVQKTQKVPDMLETEATKKHGEELDAKENEQYLAEFQEICPPGGSESVIFYTTSLRGIRKTFDDCYTVRFLLKSFRVVFYERDVSMHLEYREELWSILGCRVIPPRLFIKGRYIGGADEVVGLHEIGKLKKLLEGIPLDMSDCPCTGCANMRFVVCFNCHGSCRVFITDAEDDDQFLSTRCPNCNENGLVQCPLCC